MTGSRKTRKTDKGDNLIHLHKNVFISRGDSQYYEKVIRYLDPGSPEAHYNLAQQYEQRGLYDKALFHYKEVLKTHPSPYYYAAVNAIQRVEQPQPLQDRPKPKAVAKKESYILPSFVKIGLMLLLLLNLLLVATLYGPVAITKAVSVLKPWTVGKEVTYETVESPFLMHFLYGESSEQIEKALHKKAVELSGAYPKQSIMIYGVLSAAPNEDKKAVPLPDVSWKDKAFVIAEYNPLIDGAVKIRFLHPDFQKLKAQTEAAANIVRTALQAFIDSNGEAPASIGQLSRDYPNNYLSLIPIEAQSGSADVRTVFNGKGGWVYDRRQSEPERMFYPNVGPADREPEPIPYEPIMIVIDKIAHTLQLHSKEAVLANFQVGLGADNRTPEGMFRIDERVKDPLGKQPGVYGVAAFGIGSIAIHGTADSESIGQDRSLGCIRLANESITAIYPLVPRGARVLIVGGGGSRVAPTDAVKQTLDPRLLLTNGTRGGDNDETAGDTLFHWLG